ncbi:isochorismatase family protein [Variovorax sp. KK3]|uniref:isochorismatase family protein n=1 Tax=Variovorax sp. KK3 TaxID=1855728 RepID=UPI00097C4354|nr:isochorismatase family protein [Variovorax sp. KK3]
MSAADPTSVQAGGARIWDAFLTPTDRQWAQLRAKRPIGFGERCALLVIDLYRGGFGDRDQPLLESMREWPWSCGPHGWRALPHIRTLLAAARAAQVPVIHSTMRQSDDGLLGWMEALHGDNGGAMARGDAQRNARAKEILEEAGPRPGEAVIAKSAPSAFWGTPLVGHLQQLRVDTVLVAGMATSGCVRASVVDGAANRLRMMVVEECVFDRLEASHAVSLFDIDQKYGDVVTLDRALEAIAFHAEP